MDSKPSEGLPKVKDLICEEVTLSYFNPSKEVTLQVEASGKGLGATLLQDGMPVAFCSKALTDCEERYANIEREMLAVVYGWSMEDSWWLSQTISH